MNYIQEESTTLFIFGILIVGLLLIDLLVFNKKSHKVSMKEALKWSIMWIGLGVLFGGYIYLDMGLEKASEYYTAFLIEKALSVDNLFVFIMVFRYFNVPDAYQHKVLFYGILGAIFMRAIFIFFGVTLIDLSYLSPVQIAGHSIRINIVMTLFGGFLIYAGFKSWQSEEENTDDYSRSFGTKLIHKFFKVDPHYHRDLFFVRINGKRYATQLLVVVAVIEFTDLLFAVDSIPAIFSVSKDPVILYTSNIFAILGLRALYFLLAVAFDMFHYLKHGLAFILVFIGIKMIIAPIYHFPSTWSLLIVGFILILCILLSIYRYRTQKQTSSSSN